MGDSNIGIHVYCYRCQNCWLLNTTFVAFVFGARCFQFQWNKNKSQNHSLTRTQKLSSVVATDALPQKKWQCLFFLKPIPFTLYRSSSICISLFFLLYCLLPNSLWIAQFSSSYNNRNEIFNEISSKRIVLDTMRRKKIFEHAHAHLLQIVLAFWFLLFCFCFCFCSTPLVHVQFSTTTYHQPTSENKNKLEDSARRVLFWFDFWLCSFTHTYMHSLARSFGRLWGLFISCFFFFFCAFNQCGPQE